MWTEVRGEREVIGRGEPSIEGERKSVILLFADLSGYTTMPERLDPEEVKEIVSRIFGKIVQMVTKYEGFIEQFIGDAVLALFGVPKAHEDDPVRFSIFYPPIMFSVMMFPSKRQVLALSLSRMTSNQPPVLRVARMTTLSYPVAASYVK